MNRILFFLLILASGCSIKHSEISTIPKEIEVVIYLKAEQDSSQLIGAVDVFSPSGKSVVIADSLGVVKIKIDSNEKTRINCWANEFHEETFSLIHTTNVHSWDTTIYLRRLKIIDCNISAK